MFLYEIRFRKLPGSFRVGGVRGDPVLERIRRPCQSLALEQFGCGGKLACSWHEVLMTSGLEKQNCDQSLEFVFDLAASVSTFMY